MSNYVLITESSTDLSKEMIKSLGIIVEPLTYIIDGKEYDDKPVVTGKTAHEFYDEVRGGKMPTTSQINEHRFLELFRPILESGKDILYIGFSSALSGTVLRAKEASEQLLSEFSDRKIYVIDSKCASLGEGLLVYHAALMKNSGKPIDEVAKWVEQNKLHICHWFTVDDLNHLKRGGRVSPTVALIGTMLGIKPVMHVDNEGRLIPVSKVRGRRKSLDALVDMAEKTIIDPKNQMIFISHGDCIDDAKYLAEQMKKRLHVKDIYINFIGPVIGAHSGPGTVALFFLGTER